MHIALLLSAVTRTRDGDWTPVFSIADGVWLEEHRVSDADTIVDKMWIRRCHSIDEVADNGEQVTFVGSSGDGVWYPLKRATAVEELAPTATGDEPSSDT